MCTGLEIAGLLAGAAGSGLSMVGQMQQQKAAEENARARANARNDELKRTLRMNDQHAEDSRDAFKRVRQNLEEDTVQKDQQAATDNRTEQLTEAVQPVGDNYGMPEISGSAPNVVQSEFSKRITDALTKSTEQAERLGKLGGYGDFWANTGFDQAQAGREVGTSANLAGGNMALLPYNQDFAEHKAYKPTGSTGSFLMGLGSALGSVGGYFGG